MLLIEDGFLRSVRRDDEALSFIFDDLGIYYDAFQPSRLEELIREPLSDVDAAEAGSIMAEWRELRLSKYNGLPDYAGALPERYILVIDQVAGDLSISYGLGDRMSFREMLKAAIEENPDATILVKTHPDSGSGSLGHFDADHLRAMPRVIVVDEPCHPVRLIRYAEAVYTVTSQVGFEALIWGKKVRCFGMPFYAGWGLTGDNLEPPIRRGRVSLEQLITGALVRYPRYVDPQRQTEGDLRSVMRHIALQRQISENTPANVKAVGFSRWKQPFLKQFLAGAQVQVCDLAAQVPPDSVVALWGRETPEGLPKDATILRVEDGFLRSAGLGARLVRPLSWVVDDMGIYYDSTRPSRLEEILQHRLFTDTDLDRARKLRGMITSTGISKYNLRAPDWRRPPGSREVILVPGQVENDASLLYGSPRIRTNVDLLAALHKAKPDAYILYKPHPDVVAGLRRAGPNEQRARDFCDEVVTHADPAQLFNQIDAIHTMTSLMGFEALLRGVPVTCHGQPFYAGWGLTMDLAPVLRRTRRLSIEELTSGTLVHYPRYVSRVSGCFTTPERIVEELAAWRESSPSRASPWRRALRIILGA